MNNKSFTLLELIVVIIILGILATLGYSQYDKVVESSRLAEAKVRIGNMRQLATEYYWRNGSLEGIQGSDVGVDDTCTSTDFYRYDLGYFDAESVRLHAIRCTSAGKTPNASREYVYYLWYYPATGEGTWCCYYSDDMTSCFGLPRWL